MTKYNFQHVDDDEPFAQPGDALRYNDGHREGSVTDNEWDFPEEPAEYSEPEANPRKTSRLRPEPPITSMASKQGLLSGKRLYMLVGGVVVTLGGALAASTMLSPSVSVPRPVASQLPGQAQMQFAQTGMSGQPQQALQASLQQTPPVVTAPPSTPISLTQPAFSAGAMPQPLQPVSATPNQSQFGMQQAAASQAPGPAVAGGVNLDNLVKQLADLRGKTEIEVASIGTRLAQVETSSMETSGKIVALSAQVGQLSQNVAELKVSQPRKADKAPPAEPAPAKHEHKKAVRSDTTPHHQPDPAPKATTPKAAAEAAPAYIIHGYSGGHVWMSRASSHSQATGTTEIEEYAVGGKPVPGYGRIVDIRPNGSTWEVITDKGIIVDNGN